MANFTGSLTSLGPEHWRLRVYVGRNSRGAPVQRSRQFRGTRKQAQRALAQFVVDLENDDAPHAAEAGTLNELLGRWITHIEPNRSAATIRDYRAKMRLYVADGIGKVPLAKLDAARLDALYRELQQSGLAPATVRKVHAILSAALHQAEKWGLVGRSPTDRTTPPKLDRDNQHDAIGADELRELVAEAVRQDGDGAVLPTAIVLGAITGCRRGEARALRWTDLVTDEHTRAGILTVKRSLTVIDRDAHEVPTKTKRGRPVPLDERALAVLARRHQRQEAYAAEVGVELARDAFILSRSAAGAEPCLPDGITLGFARLVERLWPRECDANGKPIGAPRWHVHSLRHFTASVGMASGANARTVADRLGHADPSMTLRVYAHTLEAKSWELATSMSDALGLPPAR